MSVPAEEGTPPFPFLVGCGRSGTTLLRAMLDSHPSLAVPAQSVFVATMGRGRRRYERPGGFATHAFLSDLCSTPTFARWGLPERGVRTSFEGSPPGGFADAVRRVFALYALSRGKPRYGDKTPEYVLRLPLLARLFPEGLFVHVVRDGRDVALAYRDAEFGPRSVADAALFWRGRVRRGLTAGRALGPHRYHEVRYEAVVSRTEEALRPLCEFLALPFDEAMLRYFERADAIVAQTRRPSQHRSLSLPPTPGLRDWRRDMERDDLAVFEALAGRTLEDTGYERAVPRPGPAARAAAARAALAWRLRREGRRLVRRKSGHGPGST